MSDITINRWKRYGHDRAYAVGPDEQKLGWMDLTTGLVTVQDQVDPTRVTAELQAWNAKRLLGENEIPPPPAPPAPASPPSPAESPLDADDDEALGDELDTVLDDDADPNDLASHKAGKLARARAAEEWERQKRIGVIPAVLGKLVDAHSEERAWRRGAEGEERVGKVLDRLAKRGWRILHSIPVGENSDIDHLAIGPGGVILVNTKHHPKAKVSVTKFGINVNGSKTEHLKQVRAQTKRARTLLSTAAGYDVKIQACIAIYNGNISQPEMKIASSPPDVFVTTNWNIGSVLKRLDTVLTPEQVDAIFNVARRPSTWV